MDYSLEQAIKDLHHTENIICYTGREGGPWIPSTQGCVPSHAYSFRTSIGREWDKANGWREYAETDIETPDPQLVLSKEDIVELSIIGQAKLADVVHEVQKVREERNAKLKRDAEFEAFYSRVIQLMRDSNLVVDSHNPLVSGKEARAELRKVIKDSWYGQFR